MYRKIISVGSLLFTLLRHNTAYPSREKQKWQTGETVSVLIWHRKYTSASEHLALFIPRSRAVTTENGRSKLLRRIAQNEISDLILSDKSLR